MKLSDFFGTPEKFEYHGDKRELRNLLALKCWDRDADAIKYTSVFVDELMHANRDGMKIFIPLKSMIENRYTLKKIVFKLNTYFRLYPELYQNEEVMEIVLYMMLLVFNHPSLLTKWHLRKLPHPEADNSSENFADDLETFFYLDRDEMFKNTSDEVVYLYTILLQQVSLMKTRATMFLEKVSHER